MNRFSLISIAVVVVGLFITVQSPSLHSGVFTSEVLSTMLVGLTNTDRSSAQLASLAPNSRLEAAAQAKANDMAAKGYFAHTSPDGKTPWYWISAAGYAYAAAGENLAIGFFESEDVERAWMDSVGHRANILNQQYTEVGIATARGQYEGSERMFVVQMFGRPIAASQPVVGAVPAASASVLTKDTGKPTPQVLSETFIASADISILSNTVSPRTWVSIVFLILMGVLCSSIIAILFIEVRIHHVKQAVYALIVLGIILLLLYLNQSLLFSQVSVL